MVVTKPADHQQCAICCQHAPIVGDKKLTFKSVTRFRVQTQLCLTEASQGYDGVAHGGIVSLLHDAAMVNSLFAQGIRAMTASLEVRFIKPVPLHQALTVSAEVVLTKKRICQVKSTVSSQGVDYSSATAKFLTP